MNIETIGYKILETLLETKDAFIYRAQNSTDKIVLLKVMKETYSSPEETNSLSHEFDILRDKNIVGTLHPIEMIQEVSEHIMVMEDPNGINLIDTPLIKRIRNDREQITADDLLQMVDIFIKMAELINNCHEMEIVQLGVRPDRFLYVPESGELRLLSIGITEKAILARKEQLSNTRGELTGDDFSYFSPEQTGRTGRSIDYRADYYSLGVSWYEIITGQKPFISNERIGMVYSHIAVVPRPPHIVQAYIPEMLSHVIMKLLEKDPDLRYQNTDEILYDLLLYRDAVKSGGEIDHSKQKNRSTYAGLNIASKLFGREKDIQTIFDYCKRASRKSCAALMVHGSAGIGKTALIQETCRSLEDNHLILWGKGLEYQKDVPYQIVTGVFSSLAENLSNEPSILLSFWKEQLNQAMNGNGALITEIAPNMELLIGKQPQVSELGIAETRNRLFSTIENVFVALASKTSLLVVLDDLQWADQPTFELIKYLISSGNLENVRLIISCRIDDLPPDHPLFDLLHTAQIYGGVKSVALNPLNKQHVTEMLEEMFCLSNLEKSPLIDYLLKITRGNPFFIKKTLSYLFDKQCIRFVRNIQQWEWNMDEIEDAGISENIIDFMIKHILNLTSETIELLKAAAIIGGNFSSHLLSTVVGISQIDTLSRLKEAEAYEIIHPIETEYGISDNSEKTDSSTNFRFTHDRLQQACVELMSVSQRKDLHLKIGRTMKANTPAEDWADVSIEIITHLNEGIEGIVSNEERWETAKLNLWGCWKAKGASAFQPALKYIECSYYLLPENAWSDDYALTFAISKTYVECAYLNNEYDLAEIQTRALLQHTRSKLEQAEIRSMQSVLYNFQGRLQQSVQHAMLGLKALNLDATENPGMLALAMNMMAVKVRLAGKSEDTLLNLHQMDDEKIRVALGLWNNINRAAYLYGNDKLFLLSILKQMRLTLKYGSCRKVGEIFVAYSMILAIFGDYQKSYDFCQLAIRSNEMQGSFESRPTTFFSSGFFGHAWNRSWTKIDHWFEMAMEEAEKYGDHHTIAISGPFMYAFTPNVNIQELIRKTMVQLSKVKQTNNVLAFNMIFLMLHRLLNYAGRTDGVYSLNISQETYEKNGNLGMIYSEEECLRVLEKGNYLSTFGIYFKEKMFIHFFYDDHSVALEYLKKSDLYVRNHAGTPYIVECRVCAFLVLAANIASMSNAEAAKAHKRLKNEYNCVKVWAKHCPENFKHLQYLMEAEMARLSNKTFQAAELYDTAIRLANQNGFMKDEALANELAAKMLLSLEKIRQGMFYLAEAIKGYRAWGAEAKVNQMIDKYSFLLKRYGYSNTILQQTSAENLDLISIVKAYTAAAQEAQLPELLNQMMKAVIENSGAQKAIILMNSDSGWRVEASWDSESERVEIYQTVNLSDATELLPTLVIELCIHAQKDIVLSNAAIDQRFCTDPYIDKNKTRSLLSMPIMNQGTMEGILYLENNLSTNVFTEDCVRILQLLATQFLIYTKNAKLFSGLLVKTEEAHLAEEDALRSDIAFLQAQIKPHFLFNAINTISAYSLEDPEATRDLLAKLSDYLRESFDFKNRDKMVHLKKELDLVEAYLYIEKARYGDRLRVDYNIEENIDCLLPPLTIQPLVENAVQHGVSNRKGGGTVSITIQKAEGSTVISVEDDGEGIEEETIKRILENRAERTGGVALVNIQQRLSRLYGHGLKIERKETGGTKVTISIAD